MWFSVDSGRPPPRACAGSTLVVLTIFLEMIFE
jgi:hypothetical protein